MPKNPIVYRRRRRRATPLAERIARAAAQSISDQTYGTKNLKDLRAKLKAIVANDKFWSAMDGLIKSAKIVGNIDLSY